MSSSSPAVSTVAALHLHQHHTTAAARTRFYAHRVRESLTSRIAMFLCSILLTLLLVAGIIVLVLWLSLRPHRPRFYLSSFSAPSLSTLSFAVSCRNPNAKVAIYYGDISATVFNDNRQLATGVVESSFNQPPKNTTEIGGQLAAAGVQNATGESATGRVALRLELNSAVRFRLSMWDTRQHEMHVSCELTLGPDGNLLPELKEERCSLYFG